MIKRATPDHPVHEVIAKRWSPYAFADREVSDEDLFSLFEAPPRGPEGLDITPQTRTLSQNAAWMSYL